LCYSGAELWLKVEGLKLESREKKKKKKKKVKFSNSVRLFRPC